MRRAGWRLRRIRRRTARLEKGTANAIYQNLNFINRYDPDYVLILSGDHIYKMDYSQMLRLHKEMNADCTIAVLDVPLEQASRFGIMTTDGENRITEFEEKPPHPKSTKASMGIYIFNRRLLEEYLIRDEEDPKSAKDFGKNVIPAMLADERRMYAYPFSGYWKDVGTIGSLWEANMDLLGPNPNFSLFDSEWRIISRNNAETQHLIGDYARVTNSMITEGCEIYALSRIRFCPTASKVARGAYVKDSVINDNVTIGEGATVNYSVVTAIRNRRGSVVGRTEARRSRSRPSAADSGCNRRGYPGGAMQSRNLDKKRNSERKQVKTMAVTGIIFSNILTQSGELPSRTCVCSRSDAATVHILRCPIWSNSNIYNIRRHHPLHIIAGGSYRKRQGLGSRPRSGASRSCPPTITAYDNNRNSLYSTASSAQKREQRDQPHQDEYVVMEHCDVICNSISTTSSRIISLRRRYHDRGEAYEPDHRTRENQRPVRLG